MGMIIRKTNGNIGRKVDTIIRTPIAVRIMPDQKKICQIGDPRSATATGSLKAGYTGSTTGSNVVRSVGYQMLNYMVYGQPKWIDASGAHDPELVWYQGAYSTSAQSIAWGQSTSESYASFPGFHFTMPNISSPLAIKEVKVYFLNMGTTLAFGPAIYGNANNTSIDNVAIGDWSAVRIQFHVLNTPTCNYHPMDINLNSPADEVDISTPVGAGNFRGYRDIFELGQLGVRDGCIPTLTDPFIQSYTMSSTTLEHFTQNGAGWIVPTFNAYLNQYDPYSDYSPMLVFAGAGTDNYWGCFSLRNVYIDVIIDVAS